MRGSPILRAVFVFVALLALAPLLWKMTRPAVAHPIPQPEGKRATAEARLNFSTAAARVEIRHLGREVWSKSSPATAENFPLEIPWPKEGVELHVIVAWPEGTRNAALRVLLTAPDGTGYDRTLWGDTAADDVLGFP